MDVVTPPPRGLYLPCGLVTKDPWSHHHSGAAERNGINSQLAMCCMCIGGASLKELRQVVDVAHHILREQTKACSCFYVHPREWPGQLVTRLCDWLGSVPRCWEPPHGSREVESGGRGGLHGCHLTVSRDLIYTVIAVLRKKNSLHEQHSSHQ